MIQLAGALIDATLESALLRLADVVQTLDADLGMDARVDDFEHAGLDDIVVGTELQCLDDRFGLLAHGEHDHRQLGHRISLSQALQDLGARHLRHFAIEQHDVVLVLLQQRQTFGPAGSGVYLVALRLQTQLERLARRGVVVNGKNIAWLNHP